MAVGTARDRRFIGIESVERHLRRRFGGAVDTSGAADNDLLRWDATNSKWVVTSDPVVDSINVNGDITISGNIVGDGTGLKITGGNDDTENLELQGNSVDSWDPILKQSRTRLMESVTGDLTGTGAATGEGMVGYFDSGDTVTLDNAGGFLNLGAHMTVLGWHGTVELARSANGFGLATLFQNDATYQNESGQAYTIGAVASFGHQPKFLAQGAITTACSSTGLVVAPTFNTSGGATLNAGFARGVTDSCTITAGTVTSRSGLRYNDATGAGTLTSQIGVHVRAITKATTNVGILIGTDTMPGTNYDIYCQNYVRVGSYTDGTRPSASAVAAGTIIYNSTDGGLNVSNGTNWRAPSGGWVNT